MYNFFMLELIIISIRIAFVVYRRQLNKLCILHIGRYSFTTDCFNNKTDEYEKFFPTTIVLVVLLFFSEGWAGLLDCGWGVYNIKCLKTIHYIILYTWFSFINELC